MDIIKWLKGKKIGVLYGGMSAEREISLSSGKAVLKALKDLKLNAIGIDAGKNLPEQLKKNKIDFAYIVLHGNFGEDGTVQGLLEIMGIPYTGCGVLASAIAMDKIYTKRILNSMKLPTPAWSMAVKDSNSIKKEDGFAALKFPVVVKPATQGSAIGINIVNNKKELSSAFETAFKYDSKVIVEEYIKGTEITAGVLGNTALPVVEIVPANKFYDFDSKYKVGKSQHLIPPRLSAKTIKNIQELALKTFEALGCRAVARIDMIIDKNNKPWILEANTIPGMTETSLLPDEARAAGMSFNELVLKIIECSIVK